MRKVWPLMARYLATIRPIQLITIWETNLSLNSFRWLPVEVLHGGAILKNEDFRRDCRKSPQADSWVRCRKKWPHRMHHNQRSHNCEGSWDPRKSPINYTKGFFDSLGSYSRFQKSRRSSVQFETYTSEKWGSGSFKNRTLRVEMRV